MNARLPVSVLLGGLITVALFSVIQRMITPGDPAETVTVVGLPIDFIRLERDRELALKKRILPERPSRPKSLSSRPKLDRINQQSPRNMPSWAQLSLVSKLGAFGLSQLQFPGEDTDALPLFRVPPRYPLSAEQRGVEGWVDLQFAISKIGRVVEPVILDANPPGVSTTLPVGPY